MDFKSLISLANKQSSKSEGPVKRYSTEIPAPKKPPKGNVQNAAVKAFLAKKQKEEEIRAQEFVRKKQDLLELRSIAKNNRKATAMAKRTKDNNFMAHFSAAERERLALEANHAQQREDSHHSQELPPPPPPPPSKNANINREYGRDKPDIGTRDSYGTSATLGGRQAKYESAPECKPSKKPRSHPPPQNSLNFNDLLKLAAKKQHDPIVIQKPQQKIRDADVQGRLMTSEEKRRFVEEEARKQGRPLETVDLPPRRQKRKKFREEDMEAREGIVAASVLPHTKKSQNMPKSADTSRQVKNGNPVSNSGMRSTANGAPISNGGIRSTANGAPVSNGGIRNSTFTKIPKVGGVLTEHQLPSRHSMSDYPPSKREKLPNSSGQNVSHVDPKRPPPLQTPIESRARTTSLPRQPRIPLAHSSSKISPEVGKANYRRPERQDTNAHETISAPVRSSQPTKKNSLVTSKTHADTRVPTISRQVIAKEKPYQAAAIKKNVCRPTETSALSKGVPKKPLPQQDFVLKQMRSPEWEPSHDLGVKRTTLPALDGKPRQPSSVTGKPKSLSDRNMKQRTPQDLDVRERSKFQVPVGRENLVRPVSAIQKTVQSSLSQQKSLSSSSVRQNYIPGAAERRLSIDQVPRRFLPNDMGPRQFPPRDVRRPPIRPVKRRIESDDDEEDDEMNDFIDDGVGDEFDYSSHIKEIFGYDKSRYIYEPDDDDEVMESSFVRQMQEEAISTRMGILEDLEDIQRENNELKAKLRRKKK